MPENRKPFVFSTRILEPELVSRLENASLAFDQKDFITVTHQYNAESFLYYLNNPDSQARVFTSKNAVYSLQDLARQRELKIMPKKNFTVGVKATEMLGEMGIRTHARAGNAISLAQIIARNKDVKEVDFFCGDKSLDDLPEYLQSKKIDVRKEIVYKTDLADLRVETSHFDAVIFLSPTAVYSFFKKNRLQKEVPVFCIGATTSEAVHFRCDNRRIEADEPSVESVVDKVIEYFSR